MQTFLSFYMILILSKFKFKNVIFGTIKLCVN